jgi:hypothetical protein
MVLSDLFIRFFRSERGGGIGVIACGYYGLLWLMFVLPEAAREE